MNASREILGCNSLPSVPDVQRRRAPSYGRVLLRFRMCGSARICVIWISGGANLAIPRNWAICCEDAYQHRLVRRVSGHRGFIAQRERVERRRSA